MLSNFNKWNTIIGFYICNSHTWHFTVEPTWSFGTVEIYRYHK
jgi:hypothetical protein